MKKCILNDKISEFPILDSKLISGTDKPKMYNYKLVQCGSYIQIYVYDNLKIKRPNKTDYDDLNLNKININTNGVIIEKDETKENLKSIKCIEERNIIRTKLQCQRVAKANMESWKTFITLTFADNIKNIKNANNKFHNFVRMIRKHYREFMYLCVPEFQKRGAIHYHLFTNIDIENNDLMYTQKNNSKFRHIKYWNYGFDSVEPINDEPVKVVGYISKYMTKDIDNRLFGFRRYFYSQNCILPKVSYIDIDNQKDYEFYIKKIQDKELIYQNEYVDNYNDIKVQFLEFRRTN